MPDQPSSAYSATSDKAGSLSLRVNDLRFYFRAKRLVRMRDFLLQEGVKIDSALRLDDFYRLRYTPFGNSVSDEQWHRSEDLLITLNSLLPPASRPRYRATSAPYDIIFLSVIGIIILMMALHRAAWVWYKLSDDPSAYSKDELFYNNFLCYSVWVVILGLLGSLSFIIINALLITNDVKFDISNRKFVYMRLFLGMILSSVIAFPFTWYPYRDFVGFLGQSEADPGLLSFTDQWGNIIRIMMPFILGFSTTFGISIITAVSSLLSRVVAGRGQSSPRC